MYLLSLLLGAAPFAFALVRALEVRYDLRFLWLAVASSLGALLVMRLGKVRSRAPRVVLAQSALAWVVATLLAGSTAFMLGASAALSVWFVAVGFAFCSSASFALATISRPGPA
jgi:hypothetical protein